MEPAFAEGMDDTRRVAKCYSKLDLRFLDADDDEEDEDGEMLTTGAEGMVGPSAAA